MSNHWLKTIRDERLVLARKLFSKHKIEIEKRIDDAVILSASIIAQSNSCPAAAKEYWLRAAEEGIAHAAWNDPKPSARDGSGAYVDEIWESRHNCCGFIADVLLSGKYEQNTPAILYIQLNIEVDKGTLFQ
jgi:hypothetical protein